MVEPVMRPDRRAWPGSRPRRPLDRGLEPLTGSPLLQRPGSVQRDHGVGPEAPRAKARWAPRPRDAFGGVRVPGRLGLPGSAAARSVPAIWPAWREQTPSPAPQARPPRGRPAVDRGVGAAGQRPRSVHAAWIGFTVEPSQRSSSRPRRANASPWSHRAAGRRWPAHGPPPRRSRRSGSNARVRTASLWALTASSTFPLTSSAPLVDAAAVSVTACRICSVVACARGIGLPGLLGTGLEGARRGSSHPGGSRQATSRRRHQAGGGSPE